MLIIFIISGRLTSHKHSNHHSLSNLTSTICWYITTWQQNEFSVSHYIILYIINRHYQEQVEEQIQKILLHREN